jgi:hypothetical protein
MVGQLRLVPAAGRPQHPDPQVGDLAGDEPEGQPKRPALLAGDPVLRQPQLRITPLQPVQPSGVPPVVEQPHQLDPVPRRPLHQPRGHPDPPDAHHLPHPLEVQVQQQPVAVLHPQPVSTGPQQRPIRGDEHRALQRVRLRLRDSPGGRGDHLPAEPHSLVEGHHGGVLHVQPQLQVSGGVRGQLQNPLPGRPVRHRDRHVIGVPDHLEPLRQQPPVESVQVQVGQHRRQYAPNALGNFCFDVTLSYRRVERGR